MKFAFFLGAMVLLLASLSMCLAYDRHTVVHDQLPCRQNLFKNEVARLPAQNAPIGALFQNMTTHVAIVTRNQDEFDYQLNAYISAGIAPWKPLTTLSGTAQYCNQDVPFNVTVALSASRAQGFGFYEIFLLNDNVPNIFRDWYDVHGASIPYQGAEVKIDAEGNPLVSLDQFLAFLDEYQIQIIFHFNIPVSGGKNAYWIRIGFSLFEVVYINP